MKLDKNLSATSENPRVRRAMRNARQVRQWQKESVQGVVTFTGECPNCGHTVQKTIHPSRLLEGVTVTCEKCEYWVSLSMLIVWGYLEETDGEIAKGVKGNA